MLFPRLILLYTIFVFTLSNPIQRDTSGNSKRQSLDENFPDELGLNDVSNPAQSLISDPSNDSLQSQDTVPTSPSAITAINNLNSPLIDSSSELLTNESIDDLNLAGLKCVSNESIDDSYDKSDIQKRSIISESPDSSCRVPVNVFNSPKKPPGPSTPSQPSSKKTPIPAIKHDPPTNGKPCGKSSLFPGSENYNIHLSCGGPKIGDFPSNPDVVLNCAPAVQRFIQQRGYFDATDITSEFCCVEYRNQPIFWVARECFELKGPSSSAYELEVWDHERFREWREEIKKHMENAVKKQHETGN